MHKPHSLKPAISKQIHRNIAYYRVGWSPLYPSIKESINNTVPSLPGLWELYWLEKSFTPRILKMGRAWYGGLRSELRVEADGEEHRNRNIKEYLTSGDCYYRYVVCEIAADLEELYDLIASIRGVVGPRMPPPKRYDDVRVSEPDEMIIYRSHPNEKAKARESFGKRVPNMFDVVAEMKRRQAK